MAMPVNAQAIKRPVSFRSMRTLTGFSRNNTQNRITETPTRITLMPKGWASALFVKNFTALKLIAKKRLVSNKAMWAVKFLFNCLNCDLQ